MTKRTDVPRRPRRVRNYLIGFIATLVVLAVVLTLVFAGNHAIKSLATNKAQAALAPFYLPPTGWQSAVPGAVLRSERVEGVPSGGRGWRILYRTEKADGSPAVSSGLVFAPGSGAPAAPPGGRIVVAWAHPTVGLGAQCAPSRTPNVEQDVQGLANFLRAGWVVTATDYAGLGTPGVSQYLVGKAEAHDVLNSVRAARNMADVDAGTTVGLWGHSQGGNSILWTAALAPSYAPELHIVTAAVAAPAADLSILLSHQWNSAVGSLIGSEIFASWPGAYPNLKLPEVTNASLAKITKMANECVAPELIKLTISSKLGGASLIKTNPLSSAAWRAAFEANTPPPPTVPTLLIQGTKDPIVLPGSNVAYVASSCAAGSNMTGDFIGDLGHVKAGAAGAPFVFMWMQQRFSGQPTDSTCGTNSPVPPLEVVQP
jgi:pimeloyl-ACP methyl ester carboxylesterase